MPLAVLRTFLAGTSGAVTVDWVVMSAAIVGLGIASAGAVRVGTSALGDDVEASLAGADVASLNWLSAHTVTQQSFADGNFDGWSVARAGSFGAWGAMLGPFGSETLANPLTYDVELPDGLSNARIGFDLVIGDSWDGHNVPGSVTNALGDSLRLMVGGQVLTTEHFVFSSGLPGYTHGMFDERRATATVGDTTFNLVLTPRDPPSANVGGSGWVDQRWNVQIEAVNAPQTFQLGFASTANQTAPDESFGIQNFSVVAN